MFDPWSVSSWAVKLRALVTSTHIPNQQIVSLKEAKPDTDMDFNPETTVKIVMMKNDAMEFQLLFQSYEGRLQAVFQMNFISNIMSLQIFILYHESV